MPQRHTPPRQFKALEGGLQISDLQREFIEYLVDPRTPAEKGTQRDWAEAHGLDQQTPSRWKKDMAFREAWDARLHQLNIDPDRIQRVIDSVYDAAVNAPTVADRIRGATLYLQFVNRLSPQKAQPTNTERPIEELSDEELQALADNVVAMRKSKQA